MLTEKLKAYPFYLLPHHAISALMFRLARIRFAPVKNIAIRLYTAINTVNMDEAVIEDRFAYDTLNAFFTRALKPECRPFAAEPDWLCPVDGSVSQAGDIDDDRLYQAKGHRYSLDELLGGDTETAALFRGGRFATLYLSPRDYHRIHMPAAGALKSMRYVPGRLFSVATHTVNQIPRLFARNERCICLFDTADGPMAMILVGAINVSAIETTWHGLVDGRTVREQHYTDGEVRLERGAEMGRFNLGSTVIVLAQSPMRWAGGISAAKAVKLGQPLASRIS